MREYRRASHTMYACHYHFVFIPKYRKPVLRGDVGIEVRDLIREICRSEDIEILQGHVRPDHVHLLLSVPPHLAPSRVMQAIKGKTSHHLLVRVLADDRPSRDDGVSSRGGTFEVTHVTAKTAPARLVGAGHARDDDEDPEGS